MTGRAAFFLTCLIGAAISAGLALAAWGGELPPNPTVDQVKQNREALLRALLSAPAKSPPSSELEAILERVQSLRVVPRSPKPAPEAPSAAPAVQGPAEGPAEGPAAEAAANPPDEATKPRPQVALLEQLKSVPADRIGNPVALADALFRGGHPEEAAYFYEKALTKDTPAETKAWLLFQLANCRREKDPAAAQALYKRLQAEHPTSPWSAPAAAQGRLLEWVQTAGPKGLAAQAPPPGAP